MPPPAIEHRIIRSDRQRTREGLHGLTHLARAGLCDAQLNEALDVMRIVRKRAHRAGHRAGVNIGAIHNARRRPILHGLCSGWRGNSDREHDEITQATHWRAPSQW